MVNWWTTLDILNMNLNVQFLQIQIFNPQELHDTTVICKRLCYSKGFTEIREAKKQP